MVQLMSFILSYVDFLIGLNRNNISSSIIQLERYRMINGVN